MSDSHTASSPPSRRGLIVALLVIAVVALGLVWWKAGQSNRARATLVETYGAEINEIEGALDVVLRSQDLTDLSPVVPLLRTLGQVKVLGVSECSKLESFQGVSDLPMLEAITANGAVSLHSLEGLAGLPRLSEVSAPECPNLVSLSGLRDLPALEILDLSDSPKLTDTTALSGLPNLRNLYLANAASLVDLDVSGLVQLEQLDASGCGKLAHLTGVEQTVLKDLFLNTCHGLESVPKLGDVKTLVSLQLRNCPVGENLAALQGLGSLGNLVIGGVAGPADLGVLAPLTNLQELHIEGASELASLKGLAAPGLTYLSVTHCPKLTSVEGVASLKALEHLDVSKNAALNNLTDLMSHPAIVQLNLTGCKSVTDASVLAGLKQLGLLEMGGSGIPRPQVSTLKIALPELIIDLSGSSSAGPE